MVNTNCSQLLDPMAVVKDFGLPRTRVYELFAREDFPSFRVGKRMYVQREKFEQWLSDQARGSK